jgi:hypothetical protein
MDTLMVDLVRLKGPGLMSVVVGMGLGAVAAVGLWATPITLAGPLRVLPAQLAQTGQPRSDRIVGQWRSSSGPGITLAYSGRPESFWIQVFPRPGRAQPRHDYTATWVGNTRFVYTTADGAVITGQVESGGRSITVRSGRGWSARWTRVPQR